MIIFWISLGSALVILVLVLWLLSEAEEPSRNLLLAKTFGRILDGEEERVLDELRRLYKRTEHDPAVGMALGTLFRRLGNTRQAVKMHKMLCAHDDLEPAFKALILAELAADYLDSGLLERAENAVEEALLAKPGDEFAGRIAEIIFLKLKKWDKAFAAVKEVGRVLDQDVTERLALIRAEEGLSHLRADEPEPALKAFKKARKLDASCMPALIGTIQVLRRSGKPEKALQFVNKHEEWVNGMEWMPARELVKVAIDLNHENAMLEFADKQLQAFPNDWRTRAEKARFLTELGRYEEAGEALLMCLETAPHVLKLHQLFWVLIGRPGNHQRLIDAYRALISEVPDLEEPYSCRKCGFRAHKWLWRCPACFKHYSFSERHI